MLPPFPCGYRNEKMSIAATWLFQCKLLAMQFVLLNPCLAVFPLVVGIFGFDASTPMINADGSINWSSFPLWDAILQNVSICVAFWGLWVFYHGTTKELEWCNPWPKFLCIKGIVFMTYYQAIVIDILSSLGSFTATAANQYQNLIICIEMFLFAIAHVYIFPVEEWEDDYKQRREEAAKIEKQIGLRETLAFSEFFSDVNQMVNVHTFYQNGRGDSYDNSEQGSDFSQSDTFNCFLPSNEQGETTIGCFGASSPSKYTSMSDEPVSEVNNFFFRIVILT